MSERYQIKSEIEHILDRSGMYVGSTSDEIIEQLLYQPSTNKIIQVKNVLYNAGIQKLFDEILSNSVDEHRRSDALFHITTIDILINTDGTIEVKDNGGITVTKHKQSGILIPELIFGHLRTSSNYDDSQERDVIGTNGLGAKLTNIFSTYFEVETCDGKNKVNIVWTNNMRAINVSDIVRTKEHYTKIKFKIDLKRFYPDTDNEPKLSLSAIRLMQKRCIDACACNSGLTINFNSDVADGKLNSKWNFPSFSEYIKLYTSPEEFKLVKSCQSQRFKIGFIPTQLATNIVAFVNGAMCNGGSHIKVINKQITDKVLDYCKDNEMELITEKDIISRFSLFVNCSVKNPTYDSQTKERLTNKLSAYDLKLPQKFIDEILNSELIQALKDFYTVKYAEEEKKKLRKLNTALKGVKQSKKLIEATGKSQNKELWLFEGTSASNGFRKYRNPLTQCAYLLRGKIRNCVNLKKEQVLENQELREICATLKLQFGKAKDNVKNLPFDKIIVASDADFDGHHICGLFLAFVYSWFPELIEHKKVYRAQSPIIIAHNVKTNDKKYFYSLEEFKKQEHLIPQGYEVRYTKGLGGLDNDDYRALLREQKLLQFTRESKEDFDYIKIWFEKSAIQRKQILLESEGKEEDED